jgi:hypothetical protein
MKIGRDCPESTLPLCPAVPMFVSPVIIQPGRWMRPFQAALF